MTARKPKTSSPIIKKLLQKELVVKVDGVSLRLHPPKGVSSYIEITTELIASADAQDNKDYKKQAEHQLRAASLAFQACFAEFVTDEDATSLIIASGGAIGELAFTCLELCGAVPPKGTGTGAEEVPLESARTLESPSQS